MSDEEFVKEVDRMHQVVGLLVGVMTTSDKHPALEDGVLREKATAIADGLAYLVGRSDLRRGLTQ
ncbi:hypothetical protein [Candidatus Palauibacter sp.]|uniref:hypothetical protein n=1 Tax=Candidatus Palauibacter sp. TaxID=3101350 RepID=UPI003B5A3FA1